MLSLRLGTVKDFHWEFKYILIANLRLSQHLLQKKKKEKLHLTLSNQATREAKQNDTKVKRSKIKLKWVKK